MAAVVYPVAEVGGPHPGQEIIRIVEPIVTLAGGEKLELWH